MQIYEDLDEIPHIQHPVVTIGTFDGVHLGHQKILKRLGEIANAINGETVLVTFWPHPRMVLNPEGHNIKLLSSFEEKKALLRQYGVDHLISIRFTKAFSQTSSQSFVEDILIEKIGTQKLVIGYDHRFGRGREGSFEHLKANQDKYGFELEEISRQDIDNNGISSTKTRVALESGDLDTAKAFLGRPYELSGTVIKGKQIGRSLGFPTANIEVANPNKLIPMDGVYVVEVEWEGMLKEGMLNIGNRPTLSGQNKTVEVHVFEFEGDLYGKQIKVYFHDFLRREKKFDGLDSLKAQLAKDKISTMSYFQLKPK
ncbi:bifunctional riboflavin kinase/FAD synthetase [Pleomorphovibrio marinus]|uniref:bifunctional riboflavin kinase/FAD synthetase n=1 Tax=Pleomorphovibrio marinus TaxID=2164132 RepID=UPI000E0A20D0|nr:bifunctional riboflavin kinase/FAD synthetase [Pleomorphovibrio marinus]